MNTEKVNLVAENTKDVFVVWTNTDLTEGRGAEYAYAICRLEATAKRHAKGNYVMGTDCNITKEKMYRIGKRWYFPGGYEDLGTDEDKREEDRLVKEREAKMRREKVLDKARALGLTDEDIATLKT